MKNIYICFFIFLFFKVKAECKYSAFTFGGKNVQQYQDSTLSQKKYILAKKLFDNNEYSKCLKISHSVLKTTDNVVLKIKTKILISDVFKQTGYNKKAESFLKIASNYLENNKSSIINERGEEFDDISILRAQILLKLGNIYNLEDKKRDSALYFYRELINMNSRVKDFEILKAQAYSNLSGMYLSKKIVISKELAKQYVEKSIQLSKQFNDTIGLSATYGNLANIFQQENELLKAKEYNLKALDLLKNKISVEAQNVRQSVNFNLSSCLYDLEDYRACDYLNESFIIRDSLRTEKFKEDLARLDLKYNLDLIRRKEENKRLRLERSTWVISLASLIIVGILFYYLNNYKLRQKNLKLKLSKNELEQKRRLNELKSEIQDKILNATLDGKEAERKVIAETLHDNVSALLSSANMHLSAMKSQLEYSSSIPEELEKTQQIILEAGGKIRDLSHNLVSSVLLKFGLSFAVKDLAKKFSNSEIKIFAVVSNVNRYTPDQEIKLFNIIQELVNNSLKHSKSKSIYVMLEEVDRLLTIIVKDNGVGFNVEDIMSGGIGLNQIEARIRKMEGVFDVASVIGEGTKITINIPVTPIDEINYV